MLCDYVFSEQLIAWFRNNKRYMPWREDPTPYHVWVSEIMLQQTRVDTVMPYYERFIRELPDVRALAECPDERLLKYWEGLGYYSRVRNLKKAAEVCVLEYGGALPDSFSALLKLPGIGSYTAGAVSSIAFHLREPVVDGNVLRVMMRIFGRYDDIKNPATKAFLEKDLKEFLASSECDPSEFNQGLMELGALVCIPNGKPLCGECPMKDRCVACQKSLTEVLPVAEDKNTHKNEDITVFLIKCGNNLAIRKRAEKGLLSGLYELPYVEGKLTQEEAFEALKGIFRGRVKLITKLSEEKHVFSHITWKMHAYLVEASATDEFRFVSFDELKQEIPLPQAFNKWDFEALLSK